MVEIGIYDEKIWWETAFMAKKFGGRLKYDYFCSTKSYCYGREEDYI